MTTRRDFLQTAGGAWTRTAVDVILRTPGLGDADRAAVLGGNAMTLLGIKG